MNTEPTIVEGELSFDFRGRSGIYHMTVHPGGRIDCTCPAATHGRDCYHVRDVAAYLREHQIQVVHRPEEIEAIFARFDRCDEATR